MDFLDYPANCDDFDFLFSGESCKIEPASPVHLNPDEFLNLEEFQDTDTPQQLTPPISPNPTLPASSILIDSTKIRIIPIASLQYTPQHQSPHHYVQTKKIKLIVPKPSSSSDSDSSNTTTATLGLLSNYPESSNFQSSRKVPVDKALQKQQRLIKNRESAILSRKKQKDYVTTLETRNAELTKENSVLKAENSQLKVTLANYSLLSCRCASSIGRKFPSKNGTLLLAVMLLVGFNIVPFSNILVSVKKPLAAPEFRSRHLLFVENSTEKATDSVESDVYANQTEYIKNINIENIKKWIPEPDLLNTSYLKKDFDFKQDPLQEKLTKMYEKSRDLSKTTNKRAPKIKKKKQDTVQLFKSNMNMLKLYEFFDEIDRKDDTFYVFSFKADHLLLPAVDNAYNFSQIKMNLIMPRNNDSLSSDKITMFQIETIILNTSFIQLTEKSIPENFLKPNSNATMCNESPITLNEQERLKRRFNTTTTGVDNSFRPLDVKGKFPTYFNSLKLLKANSKK